MRYYITGRVLPERSGLSLTNAKAEYIEGIGEITFYCDASFFSVIIDHTEIDYHSAYFFAKDYALILVSSYGFAMGCAFSVEAIQVLTENKESYVFGVQNSSLSHPNIKEIFNVTLNLSFRDIYFRFAIRDYLQAIVSEIECPFLCYKAIETIKSRFDREYPEATWEKMHELIGTCREDILKVKKFADPIRHGAYYNMVLTNFAQRTEILLETKKVIDLYKDYLLSQ